MLSQDKAHSLAGNNIKPLWSGNNVIPSQTSTSNYSTNLCMSTINMMNDLLKNARLRKSLVTVKGFIHVD